MAIQRIYYERGSSRLLISDQEKSFQAMEKDFTNETAKNNANWLQGWNRSDEMKDLE